MKQISLYLALSDLLGKTVCSVAEKCYYGNLKTVILTEDEGQQEFINKLLWTYSKKQFIPHGSRLDPLPEKQPIYITDSLSSHDNYDAIIIVNRSLKNVNLELFNKILIVFNGDDESTAQKLLESDLKDFEVKRYIQTQQGKWENLV